ncbi:hypothetical protein CB1_001793005 [Camelus ferus]|nr:hypothetical protein CB1_001793005 [Camelus ferus]
MRRHGAASTQQVERRRPAAFSDLDTRSACSGLAQPTGSEVLVLGWPDCQLEFHFPAAPTKQTITAWPTPRTAVLVESCRSRPPLKLPVDSCCYGKDTSELTQNFKC